MSKFFYTNIFSIYTYLMYLFFLFSLIHLSLVLLVWFCVRIFFFFAEDKKQEKLFCWHLYRCFSLDMTSCFVLMKLFLCFLLNDLELFLGFFLTLLDKRKKFLKGWSLHIITKLKIFLKLLYCILSFLSSKVIPRTSFVIFYFVLFISYKNCLSCHMHDIV